MRNEELVMSNEIREDGEFREFRELREFRDSAIIIYSQSTTVP